MDAASQAFVLFKDQEIFKAKTLPVQAPSEGSKKLSPCLYVVQPNDTISKIAKKHKTTIDKIKAANPKIKEINKIYPGQKIALHGQLDTQPANAPISKPVKKAATKADAAISLPVQRSKEGKGEALALIDPDQERAPWMVIAVREAMQWAGKKEKEITKTDNYHALAGTADGNLGNVPWCASYVSYCLQQAGYPTKSASSRFPVNNKNFIKINAPVYGAIGVWKKEIRGILHFYMVPTL